MKSYQIQQTNLRTDLICPSLSSWMKVLLRKYWRCPTGFPNTSHALYSTCVDLPFITMSNTLSSKERGTMHRGTYESLAVCLLFQLSPCSRLEAWFQTHDTYNSIVLDYHCNLYSTKTKRWSQKSSNAFFLTLWSHHLSPLFPRCLLSSRMLWTNRYMEICKDVWISFKHQI